MTELTNIEGNAVLPSVDGQRFAPDERDAITTASQRLRQSGKKGLADRLDGMLLSNIGSPSPKLPWGDAPPAEVGELVAAAMSIAEQRLARSGVSAEPSTKVGEAVVHAAVTAATCNAAASDQPPAAVEASGEFPEYVPQNGEVEALENALKAGLNVLITGPTSCGKTHLVAHVARKMERNLETLQGGDGMAKEDIIGYRDVTESNGASVTAWRDGIAPRAMRNGSLLYWDEPNATPDGIRFHLFSAMDYRREITLSENAGQRVKAGNGFAVVGAMNEGAGYGGTTLLNQALRSRFEVVIDLGYLPENREAKVLESRTGCPMDVAAKLAAAASQLRAAQCARTIKTPIGTRALLACASLVASGMPIEQACELTIINQVPATLVSERNAVRDIMAAYFGKAVS